MLLVVLIRQFVLNFTAIKQIKLEHYCTQWQCVVDEKPQILYKAQSLHERVLNVLLQEQSVKYTYVPKFLRGICETKKSSFTNDFYAVSCVNLLLT